MTLELFGESKCGQHLTYDMGQIMLHDKLKSKLITGMLHRNKNTWTHILNIVLTDAPSPIWFHHWHAIIGKVKFILYYANSHKMYSFKLKNTFIII